MDGKTSSVLTIEQAAADLQTTPARIWQFHREGRLAIMYLAGSLTARRKGTKDGRIDAEVWKQFKRDLSVSFAPDPEPQPKEPRRGRPPGGGETGGSFLDKANRRLGRS